MRSKIEFKNHARRKLSEVLYPTSITFDLKLFRVITNKMDNGLEESIYFNDILLTRKVKPVKLLNGCIYILEMPTGIKIGMMRKLNIYTKNFIFNSMNENKDLYPVYKYNLRDVKNIYKVVSFPENRIKEVDASENWDNFNEVEPFLPTSREEEILQQSIIDNYFNI